MILREIKHKYTQIRESLFIKYRYIHTIRVLHTLLASTSIVLLLCGNHVTLHTVFVADVHICNFTLSPHLSIPGISEYRSRHELYTHTTVREPAICLEKNCWTQVLLRMPPVSRT